MGIQKKHGKGRLDKWYKLAKEKGYRARAAFKLIQLNRKYGFLERSKVLLDLCAAPGSWCQVAAETMPANSVIVGVDLAPIKPISRTTTFQSDITTDKCRATIRQHFKTWKADTVLHDGAPNVGTAWVQDAFSQAELTLQALRLATEFLIEGGTFVTKVFRSKDYNALLWVFNQLFTKVEATKPPSSRNVSAEIFVVCRGFKAPNRIDPKFLDPRSVFAELSEPTPNNDAKVFNPEIKKRKRDGYEEGNYTQFKEAPASEFVETTDPIAMLGSLNKLSFERHGNGYVALAALENLSETTSEIKNCCTDLKVLGRKEFRVLLKWRLQAREKFGFATRKKNEDGNLGEGVTEIVAIDDKLQIQEDLQRLTENETARRNRERRRENEKKQKETVRMQLHMMPPTEIGLEQSEPSGEDSMFALAAVTRAGAIDKVEKGKMGLYINNSKQLEYQDVTDEEDSDKDQDGLDRELDTLYDQYKERRSESNAKHQAKKARKEHKDGDWKGFPDHDDSSGVEFEQEEDISYTSDEGEHVPVYDKNAATTDALVEKREAGLTEKASSFFEQDLFKDIGVLEYGSDSGVDTGGGSTAECAHTDSEKTGGGSNYPNSPPTTIPMSHSSLEEPGGSLTSAQQDIRLDHQPGSRDKQEEQTRFQSKSSFEIVPNPLSDWEIQGEPRRDGRLDIDIITAEAMTLAQQIVSGQKTKDDLVDEGFNKFTFQDRDGLPEWFLDDEGKHSKLHRPISAAGAAAIKEKLRALNARPIKKVREAKDRKKFKAAQRLEKLRKKSAFVAVEDGISEKDKAQSIAKLMSKAVKRKPKQQVKVVVARGGNRGVYGRPRGVKGKYKIVDARLKKDVRAEKRLSKKKH